MKVNKKGVLNVDTITVWIIGIIIAVFLIEFASEAVPLGQSAGDRLNASAPVNGSNTPLAEFFTTGGLVWLIVMAALVVLFVVTFLKGLKKK